jgi:hypothetical protein
MSDTIQFIHLSDLHVQCEGLHVVGHHTHGNAEVQQLVDSLKKEFGGLENKPYVVITGDIVNGTTTKDQEETHAKDFLKCLVDDGFKLLIVPGNHDFRYMGVNNRLRHSGNFYDKLMKLMPSFKSSYDSPHRIRGEGLHEEFDRIFPTVLRASEDVYFIGLNSMDMEPGSKFYFAQGHISYSQVACLEKVLNSINMGTLCNGVKNKPMKFGKVYEFGTLFPMFTPPNPNYPFGEKSQGDGVVAVAQDIVVSSFDSASKGQNQTVESLQHTCKARIVVYFHHHPFLDDPSAYPSGEDAQSWWAHFHTQMEERTDSFMRLKGLEELKRVIQGISIFHFLRD